MSTESICECGNGLYELVERESGKCRECLEKKDPYLAVFANPIHAKFLKPQLWEGEAERIVADDGLKTDCKEFTTIKKIKFPRMTTEQRVEIAIRCAMKVYNDEKFQDWAMKWITNKDRTKQAAYAAADAASYAAHAAHAARAAYVACATADTADAASYAAHAADYAADAADVARAVYGARAAAYAADAADWARAAYAARAAAHAAYAAAHAATDAAAYAATDAAYAADWARAAARVAGFNLIDIIHEVVKGGDKQWQK